MHPSDEPLSLLPEGTYDFILREVSGDISRHKRTPYLRLNFMSKEPIDGKVQLVACTIIGNWQHTHAWKRCIGQSFKLRIRHRELPDQSLTLDPAVME